MTSIISAIRTYVATFEGLKEGSPLFVDFLGPEPTQYTIIPLAGTKIVETYLNNSSLREVPFALRTMESTADDLERMENSGFLEAFSDWLESQTLAGALPTLNANQTPEKIEVTGWGYLYQQGQSETGVYQIQCKLTYRQDAPAS